MTRVLVLLCFVLGVVLAQNVKFKIFHTTDVHGWVAGHPHNETLNTDFGDFASLVEHVHAQSIEEGFEFLMFDSGDLIEGTGLSDASEIHGRYIFPIVQKIPHYVALTMGNHDIGHSATVELMRDSFIPHYNRNPSEINGRYLTANSHMKDSNEFIGEPYFVYHTRSGFRLLVLGFLYNFTLEATVTEVDMVADTLKQEWFVNAMKIKDVDMVAVTMHIDPQSYPEMQQIYTAIRASYPTIPLLLFTGHRHRLYYETLDFNSFAIESGKYFENLGVIEFDINKHQRVMSNLTQYWVPTSLDNFYKISKKSSSDFLTVLGVETKLMIADFEEKLNLTAPLGCSPSTFSPYVPILDRNQSLYNLYVQHIVPSQVFNRTYSKNPYFITNTATLRYDLYAGVVNRNDIFTINPFNDNYFFYPSMSGSDLFTLISNISNPFLSASRFHQRTPYERDCGRSRGTSSFNPSPAFYHSLEVIDSSLEYDVIMAAYDASSLQPVIAQLLPSYAALHPDPVRYPTDVDSTSSLMNFVSSSFACSVFCSCPSPSPSSSSSRVVVNP